MMGVAQLFEDFGSRLAETTELPEGGSEELEELKLKSFESGYGAGWDDAIKAQAEGSRVVSEALEQTLLDMSFSREEAFQAYIKAMRPALEQILTKVLPKLADQALLQHIATLLEQTLNSSENVPIELRVAPENQSTVAKLVEEILPEGGQVLADTSLTENQAHFTLGESESRIDLDALIVDIRGAITEFHFTAQGETFDG